MRATGSYIDGFAQAFVIPRNRPLRSQYLDYLFPHDSEAITEHVLCSDIFFTPFCCA